MKGVCELYKIDADLRQSHVFPKFIINYSKNTGSQYFRKIEEPNKRMQDGIKFHLLSHEAEQEFSIREKWFAENIFVPYLNGKKELKYTEQLYYFAISFLWRILITDVKANESYKSKWFYNDLLIAEEQWRLFLTKNTFPYNHNEINLLFTDRIVSHNTNLKGVDFYFTRIMDATIVSNKEQTYLAVYGKFNRFIFWAELKNNLNENLNSVKINPIKGIFKIPQMIRRASIIDFMGNRIRDINKFPLPNHEQQIKIENEILKNPKKFWESDLGKSLLNDKFNLDN